MICKMPLDFQREEKLPSENPTYISLFSGAGIGCHGLALAGFSCVATVESVARRIEIQRFNQICRLDSGYICGDMLVPDIQERVVAEAKKWGVDAPGMLDVIIATPPCQGMSVCNHKKGDEKGRNSLVVAAIKMAALLRPKVFIFENTALFLSTPCALPDGEMPIGAAIQKLLGGEYCILPQRLNLKNYGCPSSRTRTLVIGVDKRCWFSPLGVAPDWTPETTLRKVIGDLPPLANMGEISAADIYHSAKPYPEHMRDWISDLREGQSAFEQSASTKRPHKLVGGRRIENKNAQGDKYRRQKWDAAPPCVHTRNDIMSSQNTIHPVDNRVFSVRELMRMMSVPPDFKWSQESLADISSLPPDARRRFLRANEMNIRQCLGEAVPTNVIRGIAEKIKACLSETTKPRRHERKQATAPAFSNRESAQSRLRPLVAGAELESLMRAIELENEKRGEHAAYYTPPVTAFKLLQMLPDLRSRSKIRVLEPAAGIGRILRFLPQLLAGHDEVVIDVMDIDPCALAIARAIIAKFAPPAHVKINYLRGDFLDRDFANEGYDLIVGNPPFGKMAAADIRRYAKTADAAGSRNIFALFLAKALKLARHVVMIAPKSILSAPDFEGLRAKINARHTVRAICDFGEKGFAGVRIETIALSIDADRRQKAGDLIAIESMPRNFRHCDAPSRVFDGDMPYWLIYRDERFEQSLKKMRLGVFDVFRDRQISKRHFYANGGVRVIKSRNVGSLRAERTASDVFVRDVSEFAARRFMNRPDVLLTPNLSYNPRACRMPENCVADGSVAILRPRNGLGRLEDDDVKFFASAHFCDFYRVARNYGTRGLNIDAKSVFFFGVREAHAR